MKYILLIFGLFLSCNRSDKAYVNLETKLKGDLNIDIKFESFSIPIDSITYNRYACFSNFNLNNCDYLAGYNGKIHSIDIFNLTNRTFLKHLFLNKDGPNQLSFVSGLYVINWDSIIVYSDFDVCIIDSSGNIKYKRDLSKIAIKESGFSRSLSSTYSTNMFYSEERNSIFLIYTPRNVKFWSESFLKIPFLAEFNLTINTLELVPVYYSNFFVENSFVADSYEPFVKIFKNKIYYCFSGESNIYSFDLDTKVLETFGARSSFTDNITKPIRFTNNLTILTRHRLENVSFLNVLYDPYRNLFYRFHYGEQKYKVSAYKYNTFFDKKLYLMIFDSEFKLIKEIKLDDYTYNTNFYGVTREGLVLNANHELKPDYNDNLAQFKLLKINLLNNENK